MDHELERAFNILKCPTNFEDSEVIAARALLLEYSQLLQANGNAMGQAVEEMSTGSANWDRNGEA